MRKICLGDRVAYSANWLRSTGNIVGELGFMRGTVVGLEAFGAGALATVEWDSGQTWKVLDANLARVGTPAMSAN